VEPHACACRLIRRADGRSRLRPSVRPLKELDALLTGCRTRHCHTAAHGRPLRQIGAVVPLLRDVDHMRLPDLATIDAAAILAGLASELLVLAAFAALALAVRLQILRGAAIAGQTPPGRPDGRPLRASWRTARSVPHTPDRPAASPR
jgi:hypothetical protein